MDKFEGIILGEGLCDSLFNWDKLIFNDVIFESVHEKFFELFIVQTVPDILNDVVYAFLIWVEFPVPPLNHTFILLLHLFGHYTQRTIGTEQQSRVILYVIHRSVVLCFA